MDQTSTIQGQVGNLWTTILINASSMPAMLGDKQSQLTTFEATVNEQLVGILAKIHLDEKILSVHPSFKEINVNLKNLYEAIEYVDIDDAYSILDLLREVLDLIKNIMAHVFDFSNESKTQFENTLDTFEELIADIIDLFQYSYDDSEHSLLEWSVLLKKTISNFTDQLNELGVSHDITDNINKATVPILNIIIMAVAQKVQNAGENDRSWDAETADDYEYRREFEPETENVIHNVTENFSKIYTEIEHIPLVSELALQETDLKDIWNESVSRFRSLDPDGYFDIEYAFENIRENIEETFDFINNKYLQNRTELADLLNNTIKPHLIEWLTLPDDFRPNNWIEVIHVVVQNIQFSLRTSLKGVLPVEQFVLPFIHKLDYILSQVDNETFKLLITPKEEPQIHEVYLPDILDPEESEEKYSQPSLSPAATDMSPARTEIPSAVDTASTDTADEPETPPKRLTYGLVIDFLCFDKTHGATAKMDGELADVIKDLYYWDWLSGKLYYLEDELMSLFDKEKYWGYWEDIKTKLLDENGVNIGAFIDYLMDKGVSIINSVLDFIKETIQYFIDEVFKLAKAIIDFFQKVDLPPVARDLLKKIPAFDKMPDNVTLLHILAAIPYTLYQEFVHFVVPSELQTA
jgi:hypothetical protein